MLIISLLMIACGIFCLWMITVKRRNLKKTNREITNFDIWDNFAWKSGLVIGIIGIILLIIEFLKPLLK